MAFPGHEDYRRSDLSERRRVRLHLKEPDYTRPLLEIPEESRRAILKELETLYGRDRAEACFPELERLMQVHYAHKTDEMIEEDRKFDPRERFSERDVVVISYGDVIRSPGKSPLQALGGVLNILLRRTVNTIHLLPFFPYSSDRGFSIIDYETVDPGLGSWEDITGLSLDYRLMFDGVINHVSSKSRWFQEFLNGNPEYRDFFITFSTREAVDEDHLKLIMRPRTSDLLTGVQTLYGTRYVWTTFSPDQIDLNYKNEKVLLRIVEILLFHIRQGADLIRLDAVTYLWTELGTRCAYLEETHVLVRLFRLILDVAAPQVALVTETNVAHEDNIRYFGNGHDEAQMVYNFAFPPLVLRTFQTKNAERLLDWVESLEYVSDTATYLNFLDSHDGIGLPAVRNLLPQEEIDDMVDRVRRHGGLVSYRRDSSGKGSPYELNITWFSALNREDADEDRSLQVDRFIASRAVALALRGVPGVYLHSLIGSRNDQEAILQGEEARSINRANIDERALLRKLTDPDSTGHHIARRFADLIETRIRTPAFHPNGEQRVLKGFPQVFALVRTAPDGRQVVVALTNVTHRRCEVSWSSRELGLCCQVWTDLVSGEILPAESGGLRTTLDPYQVLWLQPELTTASVREG